MTLINSFSLFSLQVMEKLNLAFWNFAYFQNWLYILVWFSTLTFKPFQYVRKSYVPKENDRTRKYIVKYVCLVHYYTVKATCLSEFLKLYRSEICRETTPSRGPFCWTWDPAFGIKVANVVIRFTCVAGLSTFCMFESVGNNIWALCTRVLT